MDLMDIRYLSTGARRARTRGLSLMAGSHGTSKYPNQATFGRSWKLSLAIAKPAADIRPELCHLLFEL